MEKFFCTYILFSEKLDRFYIGTTDNIEKRFIEHNSKKHEDAFTSKGIPWKLEFLISGLSSAQAYLIEKHIKAMKSKKYIENLLKYPEMREKLVERFKDSTK